MKTDLHGRVVLITGASGGIGSGMAVSVRQVPIQDTARLFERVNLGVPKSYQDATNSHQEHPRLN